MIDQCAQSAGQDTPSRRLASAKEPARAVVIATPDLGRSFGQTGPVLSWVVNAFMLVFGALPWVTGTLADRIGRRKVFRISLVGSSSAGLG